MINAPYENWETNIHQLLEKGQVASALERTAGIEDREKREQLFRKCFFTLGRLGRSNEALSLISAPTHKTVIEILDLIKVNGYRESIRQLIEGTQKALGTTPENILKKESQEIAA